MSEVDEAIEQYRHELVAEASLARGDLDEIEDHLRALIDELRQHQPLAVAIAVARTRLGDPRALAREHARVHGSFGPPLSRWRAVSAVALLVPLLAQGLYHMPLSALVATPHGLELLAGVVLAIALIARRGWARPVLFAGAALWAVPLTVELAYYPVNPLWLGCHLGIAAFLAPWRRREVTRASVALALQVWAFVAATVVMGFTISTRGGEMELVTPAARIAFAAAALATAGGILRARWSAICSLAAVVALAVSIQQLAGITFRFPNGGVYQLMTFGLLASGAIASLAAGVLLWRHARTRLGSLREAFAA